MPRFIELHSCFDNDEVFINIDKIISVYPQDNVTIINTDNPKWMVVEDYLTVKRLIENELRKS